MQEIKNGRFVSEEEYARQRSFSEFIREENEKYLIDNGVRRKVFVMTLGCQQNEADSEKLLGMSEAMGYKETSTPDDASLIIVNTCAIREHAEKRALSIVGQYKHIKAKNPELIICICGCMVVQEHRIQDIKMRYPYVDLLFGTSSIHKLPELLAEKIRRGKRVLRADSGEYLVAEGAPIKRASSYKAWVSVMYGCNNFCSYCIVPYVRGRERSRKMSDVVAEVRELVEKGYKDITLLGQNVNSYNGGCDFATLLNDCASLGGEYRVRFMTSHPKDASSALVDAIASNDNFNRSKGGIMRQNRNRVQRYRKICGCANFELKKF